jgi:hypothetical protein
LADGLMLVFQHPVNDLKTVKGAGRAPVSGNGFSLTFSRKGFKSQTFERHDPAAVTRGPASRNH